jgi:hypothetical protein
LEADEDWPSQPLIGRSSLRFGKESELKVGIFAVGKATLASGTPVKP